MAYPCVPGQRQLLAVLDCPLSFFIANDNIDEMSQGLLLCSRSQGGVAYRSFPRPIDKVDPENVDILCDVVSGAMDVIWNFSFTRSSSYVYTYSVLHSGDP